MAQAVAFRDILQMLGFQQNAIAALNSNGLGTTQDLVGLTDKDVEQILKIICPGPPPVNVPYLAQKRLNIFCYWATRCHHLNEAIEPKLLNHAQVDSYGRMMSLMTQDEETSTIVKSPAEFKTGSKWKPFKEGAIAYLNSVMGTHGIPLAYIICEQE
jgi:hypothetical protein